MMRTLRARIGKQYFRSWEPCPKSATVPWLEQLPPAMATTAQTAVAAAHHAGKAPMSPLQTPTAAQGKVRAATHDKVVDHLSRVSACRAMGRNSSLSLIVFIIVLLRYALLPLTGPDGSLGESRVLGISGLPYEPIAQGPRTQKYTF